MQTFRQAIRTRDFTLSAELKLDARSTPGSIVDQGRTLKTMVDAVQVTDNPIGRVHLSPLVVAGILLKHQIDPVLHMTCRDRNRVALHSDLLGAAALGVTSLLIMRGKKYPKNISPKIKGVFDWGVNRLIADARAMFNFQKRHSPLGRTVTLDEIGGAALYLLSDLSTGVTGEIHYVDSGYNIISTPRPENLKDPEAENGAEAENANPLRDAAQ